MTTIKDEFTYHEMMAHPILATHPNPRHVLIVGGGDGMFVAQTDNPWFKADLIRKVNRDIKEIFPITRLYTANVPTYPSGLWAFQIGSKKHDPLAVELDIDSINKMEIKYYSPAIHKACFALPKFVEELVK